MGCVGGGWGEGGGRLCLSGPSVVQRSVDVQGGGDCGGGGCDGGGGEGGVQRRLSVRVGGHVRVDIWYIWKTAQGRVLQML